MSASKKASIVHNKRPQAKLTMRRRFLPLAPLLPLARFFLTVVLIAVGGYAAWNYFINTPGASALQFTAHLIGTSGGALGVLDVQVGDMNGDGIPDVVIGGTKGIVVYTQDKKHNFTRTVVDGASTVRIQLVDLDKDGSLDIVASLKNGPGAKWYHNNGNLTFTGHNLGSAPGAGVAAAGDIDGDGNKDIVTAVDSGDGAIALQRWMGDGTGNFSGPITLSADSGVTAMAIGDINDNGFNDIVTGGRDGLQHWDTHDGVTWSRADIDSDHANGTDIALADINGDGKVDILTADQAGNKTTYYRNTDNSNAFDRIELDGDADASTILAADMNNDGAMDIVTAAQDDNSVYLYQNDGSDSFTRSTLVTNLQSVFGVAVADISGDKNLDVVAGDLFRGNLYWYERVLALPVASAPTNIKQSTGGHGIITFDTNLSSADYNATRLKVEYSLDGTTWFRPALTAVTATVGSTDLNTNATYQVGSSNPIDTDETDSIKLTLTWDTRATTNGGGPLIGNQANVMVRLTPRDNVLVGDPSVSAGFLVDNQGPTNVTGFQVAGTSKDQIQLAWQKPTDRSDFTYAISYGTDPVAVAAKKASLWNVDNDKNLGDQATTGTIVTGLTDNTTYSFKLFVSDVYGNTTASPVISAATSDTGVLPSQSPTPLASPSGSPGTGASGLPVTSITPTVLLTPSATPPPANFQNHAPVADAGQDQLVNPNALVILDGTASADADGDPLTYSWRQLSGPQIDLLSSRTATPSFSAGGENLAYIFALTVRDPKGASSTDVVTVATRILPAGNTIAVVTDKSKPVVQPIKQIPTYELILQPVDYVLLILALLLTAVSVLDRLTRRSGNHPSSAPSLSADSSPRGKVVNSKTGQPIVGAQVLVYGTDGKLRTQLKTSSKGEFETLFPPGQYTISVQVEGFTFAPLATGAVKSADGMLYSGGTLTVTDGTKPVAMTIPMKPTAADVGEWRTRLLHVWQSVQRLGRMFSWPVFLVGALLNTALIFLDPGILYLVIEVLYVGLVILKVSLEVRVRPAYGLIRDAITHVPLDLAVVRLYDEKTNRLIMTRVANAQGKFFALPSAGTYAISVTKPGYATFTKQHLAITGEQDSVLQITSDLMPVTPQGGLNTARAAVL